jgi:hypothetical protein
MVTSTDPRLVRLSDNFLLSDFLGNHSVYSKGLANPFVFDGKSALKLDNIRCLCQEGLEPLMRQFGGLSVAYGYVSPELSRRIVTYMDPDKPSHHRWDLGAAADVCFHKWVTGDFPTLIDLYAPGSAIGSPIALAHAIDYLDIPYSRMITYSESPYICLALSAREFVADSPRKAFYENRFQGLAKAKPDYRQYATPQAKQRAFEALQTIGLEHPWQGAGYPTYHGGGFQQYQHMRVSRHTMVSDWLFDLQSISNGAKNVPCLNLANVQDAFAAAGIVYDWMIDILERPRLSIVEGYVSHTNPNSRDYNDWREPTISFHVATPGGLVTADALAVLEAMTVDGVQFTADMSTGTLVAVVDVSEILERW